MNYSSVALAEVTIINPPTPQSLSESEEVAFIPMAAVNSDLIEVESSETGLAISKTATFLLPRSPPALKTGKLHLPVFANNMVLDRQSFTLFVQLEINSILASLCITFARID